MISILATLVLLAILGGFSAAVFFIIRFFARQAIHTPELPDIEHQLTVSEFNAVLDAHAADAQAPLLEKIEALEQTLHDREMELAKLKRKET